MESPSGRPVVDVIEEGLDLYTSDGEKVGHVDEINPQFFIISKGLFGGQQMYIPRTGDERQEGDRVYANLTRDEIESGDYSQPTASQGGDVEYEREVYETAPQQSSSGGTDTIRRYEEELQADKTQREAGSVRVTKDVVEEQQSVAVPVTREEVQVRSRPVDREVGDAGDAFQSQTVDVPVMEEQVEVRKTPRAVEEIEIEKVATQDTQNVSDTVRKERINVDEQGTTRSESTTDEWGGSR